MSVLLAVDGSSITEHLARALGFMHHSTPAEGYGVDLVVSVTSSGIKAAMERQKVGGNLVYLRRDVGCTAGDRHFHHYK